MLNTIQVAEASEFMKLMPDNFIDLTVTSPPYDNLRKYKGYSFDFESIAKGLYRITKIGGVLVWVVADATIKGSETGSSFKQALFFMSLGFNLHDTMIWDKKHVFGTAGNPALRYQQSFEYIFVFTRGRVKTFNPLLVPCLQAGKIYSGTTRRDRRSSTITDCLTVKRNIVNKDVKIPNNIFTYPVGFNKTSKNKSSFKHPAVFPFQLAKDNIISWSNPLDVVFDPFSGSGTTSEEAKKLGRYFVACDISEEYVTDSLERIAKIDDQTYILS